ncbi:winged helix-turn-helix domain-containing protein [Candidatus Woesearchaeota archaeon]|nr:winged helix-turn-helix domain-containing protein [Candidatus Woesearchaeota archaeon]
MATKSLDSKVKELFGAINSNLKAEILSFALYEYQPVSSTDIEFRLMGLTGKSIRRPKKNRNYTNHLGDAKALGPFVRGGKKKKKWMLSGKGADYGALAARFALSVALKYNTSLDDIFGRNQRDGPYNTFQILRHIYGNGIVTLSQISKDLGISKSAVAKRISYFQSIGVISYDSISSKNGAQIEYSFTKKPGKWKHLSGKCRYPGIAADIVGASAKLPEYFSYDSVMEQIGKKSEKAVKQALRELVKAGYIEPKRKWAGSYKRSHIKITPHGEGFYKELFGTLIGILNFDLSSIEYAKNNSLKPIQLIRLAS